MKFVELNCRQSNLTTYGEDVECQRLGNKIPRGENKNGEVSSF